MNKKEFHPGDTLEFVEQLKQPIHEDWLNFIINVANINAESVVSESDRDKKTIEAIEEGPPMNHIKQAEFEQLKELHAHTRGLKYGRAKEIMDFAVAAHEWNKLLPEDRKQQVVLYSRAWAMHLFTRDIPRQEPKLPPHLKFFTGEDYFNLCKINDTRVEMIRAASRLRSVMDWEALPDNFLKKLLSKDFRSPYEPFYDAYMANALNQGIQNEP